MSEGLDVTPRYYQPNEGSKGLTYNKIPGGPSGCFGVFGVLGVLLFWVWGFWGFWGFGFLVFWGFGFFGFLGVLGSEFRAQGFRIQGCRRVFKGLDRVSQCFL